MEALRAAVRLVQPLQKSIPVKQRMLDSLVARYKRCVDLGASEWANAATFRIGQALIAFGEALEGATDPPIYKGMTAGPTTVLLQQSQTFYDRGEECGPSCCDRRARPRAIPGSPRRAPRCGTGWAAASISGRRPTTR